jgi:hypothetical protein
MKTKQQIHSSVRNYIELSATKSKLIDMLVEIIDNYDERIYLDLYARHIEKLVRDETEN